MERKEWEGKNMGNLVERRIRTGKRKSECEGRNTWKFTEVWKESSGNSTKIRDGKQDDWK